MNILDIIIIVLIIIGALLGFVNGGIKTFVSAIGFIVVATISFMLKDIVAEVLFKICPFFNFFGVIKGVTSINILLYEVIAFIVIFGILYGILKLVTFFTGIVEKILSATIILSIPSKIIGMVIGTIENFLLVFITLYFLSLPFFNYGFINNSKLKDKILYNTPILSNFVEKNVKINHELNDLIEKYKNEEDKSKLNLETLNLMLKYKIVSVDTVEDLVKRDKLKIDYVYTVLDKYR